MQSSSPSKPDAKSKSANAKRARALTKLSSAHQDLGAFQAALDPAREALELYRSLVTLDPETFLAELADALERTSRILGELRQHEAALVHVMEAMDAYRRLVKSRPEAYLPRFALVLTNLSAQLRHLGRHQEALPLAQSAVEWLWPHYERSPSIHEKPMGTMFSVLVALHEDLDRRLEPIWARRFEQYAARAANVTKERMSPVTTSPKKSKGKAGKKAKL